MLSSTTFFSNNLKVQRARPLGGLEQAKAISLASFSPSKIRATAGIARCLRLNTASKPSSLSALQAVAYPAQTPYYYFRARCDGSNLHNFSETYDQHLDNGCQ